MPTFTTSVGSLPTAQANDAIVVHNGFAGPVAPPVSQVATAPFVAPGDDGAIAMIDNVVYPDTAALVIVPTAIAIGNATASSSPIIIDSTILYQARASFVTPPTAAAPVPLPGQATASSSPVVIESTVLYQARASYVRVPDAPTQVTFAITQFPLPAPLVAIIASWMPETAALAPPSTFVEALQTFDQWPIPSVLGINQTSVSSTPGFSSKAPPVLTGTSFWFPQWSIPAALRINSVSVLPGFGAVTFPMVTTVLGTTVANWYVPYPIPPAKGAINVAALIDGFTWSESSSGGTKVAALHAPHFFSTMGMCIGAPANPPS